MFDIILFIIFDVFFNIIKMILYYTGKIIISLLFFKSKKIIQKKYFWRKDIYTDNNYDIASRIVFLVGGGFYLLLATVLFLSLYKF